MLNLRGNAVTDRRGQCDAVIRCANRSCLDFDTDLAAVVVVRSAISMVGEHHEKRILRPARNESVTNCSDPTHDFRTVAIALLREFVGLCMIVVPVRRPHDT